jgi:hypothetical protein
MELFVWLISVVVATVVSCFVNELLVRLIKNPKRTEARYSKQGRRLTQHAADWWDAPLRKFSSFLLKKIRTYYFADSTTYTGNPLFS